MGKHNQSQGANKRNGGQGLGGGSQSAMDNGLAGNSRMLNHSPSQNSQYSNGGKGQKKKLAGGLSQSAI